MNTNPSFAEFDRMARQGNLIPVFREFLADTETPVSAYLKIRNRSFSYLLESAEGGRSWGRYSFIGYQPDLTVTASDRELDIRDGNGRRTVSGVSNPLMVLKELSRTFRPAISPHLPPFQGGLVGYVDYDLVRKWERLPATPAEGGGGADLVFTFCRRLIIFDHLTHRIHVVAYAFPDRNATLEEAYAQACEEVDDAVQQLNRPLPFAETQRSFAVSGLEANFTRAGFEEAVRRVKAYIEAGEVIQVVLSQRFSGNASGEPFSLYRSLRSVNPSPYMFYLDFGDTRLIGASPEILARLTDGKIEVRPIAGTRPRGKTGEEDRMFERELLADPKERAEHIMLVDLGRNDVGKVASPGSVSVPRLMDVERYSHVMHLVSRVEATLRTGADAFDLFMAAFPAGTVSGAPKIRAMEIISELEPSRRGPYAGAVGYFGFNGNMDFCITIRTISIQGDRVSVQVGAGIVADSAPEKEYEETLRKGEAMFRAIQAVGHPGEGPGSTNVPGARAFQWPGTSSRSSGTLGLPRSNCPRFLSDGTEGPPEGSKNDPADR